VPIALSAVVIIIAAIVCRYCVNKKQRQELEAQNRVQRAKDFKINPDIGEK